MSRLLLTGTLALVLTLIAVAPAKAADGCPDRKVAQVFKPWLDPAQYLLARGGAFEGALRGWELDGARTVRGNEPFHLNSHDDERSLRISAGETATSSRNCVSLTEPTVRFLARSTGSPLAFLVVSAVVPDGPGLREVPIGVVSGLAARWAPSLPMVLANGLLGSAVDGTVELQLRFSVAGAGGEFRVDDVYIDPYGRG